MNNTTVFICDLLKFWVGLHIALLAVPGLFAWSEILTAMGVM